MFHDGIGDDVGPANVPAPEAAGGYRSDSLLEREPIETAH